MIWTEVNEVQAIEFQQNMLKTVLQLEATFFDMAREDKKNVIVICDRGSMDPSACEYRMYMCVSLNMSMHGLHVCKEK